MGRTVHQEMFDRFPPAAGLAWRGDRILGQNPSEHYSVWARRLVYDVAAR